ncbi:hypothetical protein V496_00856 [Pseudogymnoascus sp. VKM F-4515 (FW-2607)]|nr:hypothetical protein V496_00856 [Pseudogymnoascus sp. VKM F-4515 (FW-2607)]
MLGQILTPTILYTVVIVAATVADAIRNRKLWSLDQTKSFLPIEAKTSGAAANCYGVPGNPTSVDVPASLLAEATMALDAASRSLSPLPAVLSHGLIPVSTFGLLSFISSTSLFLWLTFRLISWRRKSAVKGPINQFLFLIYNLLFANIQQALAFVLNIHALRHNAIEVGTSMCFAQGWFVSTGDLASSVFICAIAVHTFFSVVKDYRLPTVAFYCCIAGLWTFVYVMALIGPLVHRHDFYVRASAWCWINDAYQNERLWLHYFWIFVCMFSSILIYATIFIYLRARSQGGDMSSQMIRHATALMILYPVIYIVCTAPLAISRIAALAGNEVSLAYFCVAGSMIACNGWLDVLLYATTRADIVFTAYPPLDDIRLETFAFMGKGHTFGTVTTVEAGPRGASRLGGGWRSQGGDSVENLYGLDKIKVKGEVTFISNGPAAWAYRDSLQPTTILRIACLQFAPQLGDVDQNLNRADAVLSKANLKDIDLLVLPELAFSSYNFKSLKDISPYLEPTAAVGYPEKVDISPKWPASPEYYSLAITVNKEGETIANYRKSFLYYTDETWALEGPDGFYNGVIEGLGNVAMGICMDLKQANIVIIFMAWVTREDARSYSRLPKEPDMETLAYWVARLEPLIRGEDDGEVIVVLANRSSTEGDATYASTSAVLGIQSGEVKLYGVLGRGERELLVVDTSKRPQAKLRSLARLEKRARIAPSLADSPSIDEVLGAGILLSPVEPISPYIFFASKPIGPEDRQPLKSTITNPSTPAPDTGVFERPSSPKSRNASRTRQPVQQEQALYTHDLAGVELLAKRPPSQNRTGNIDIDMDVKRAPAMRPLLHSASEAMNVDFPYGLAGSKWLGGEEKPLRHTQRRDAGRERTTTFTDAQRIATYAASCLSLSVVLFVSAFVSVFVGVFVGVFICMVFVSKSAIQCPSPSCNFAYFASSLDPAGKLRNHFNNFKSRDAEHESYFQKPFCDIAVILSPSQLQRLANEWQLEYELGEGDLIIRKGRATHLSRGMVIARCTSKQDSVPSLKRRRTSYEQIQPVEVSHCAVSNSKPLIEEASAPVRVNTQNAPIMSPVRDELYIAGEHSSNPLENETTYEGCLFSDKRQPSAGLLSGTRGELSPGGSTPPLESYTGDAFAAMISNFLVYCRNLFSMTIRDASIPFRMANTSIEATIEVTEQERTLGELSRANLQAARRLFKSNGLPTENDFIYVNTRSLLPREIIYNKFITAFLTSHFPTAKLLQIYARHATRSGAISLRSPDAIAPLLIQVIIAYGKDPISVKIDCGGCCTHLKGNGLAVVRYSAIDITIHVESENYSVVTMDYALSEEK